MEWPRTSASDHQRPLEKLNSSRFWCIVHPFKQKLTIPTAVGFVTVIWILAVAIMCPLTVLLQVQEEKHFCVLLGSGNSTPLVFWCREEWPELGTKIYVTVLFANIYLSPLSLIVVMCARISTSLSHAGGSTATSTHSMWKRKQKVIKMLIIVTLLFTLSWLPLWTLMLLLDHAGLSDLINICIYPFAHWLAFLNSSISPIVYGFCNKNFAVVSRPSSSSSSVPSLARAMPTAGQPRIQLPKQLQSRRRQLRKEIG